MLGAVSPVDAVPATVGDASDLLDIDVNHVAREACRDGADLPVGGAVRVEIAQA